MDAMLPLNQHAIAIVQVTRAPHLVVRLVLRLHHFPSGGEKLEKAWSGVEWSGVEWSGVEWIDYVFREFVSYGTKSVLVFLCFNGGVDELGTEMHENFTPTCNQCFVGHVDGSCESKNCPFRCGCLLDCVPRLSGGSIFAS